MFLYSIFIVFTVLFSIVNSMFLYNSPGTINEDGDIIYLPTKNELNNLYQSYDSIQTQTHANYFKDYDKNTGPYRITYKIVNYPVLNYQTNLDKNTIETIIEESFQSWADIANIEIVDYEAPVHIHQKIHIGFFEEVCDRPGKEPLAIGCFRYTGNGVYSTINFQRAFWVSVKTQSSMFLDYNKNVLAHNFRHTCIHEIGHALWLNHSPNYYDVMYPTARPINNYKDEQNIITDYDKQRIIETFGPSKKYINTLTLPTTLPSTLSTPKKNIKVDNVKITDEHLKLIKLLSDILQIGKKKIKKNIEKDSILTQEHPTYKSCSNLKFTSLIVNENGFSLFTNTSVYISSSNIEDIQTMKEPLTPISIDNLWKCDNLTVNAILPFSNGDKILFGERKYIKINRNGLMYPEYPKKINDEFPLVGNNITGAGIYENKVFLFKEKKYYIIDTTNPSHICNYPKPNTLLGLRENDFVTAFDIKDASSSYFIINGTELAIYDNKQYKISKRFIIDIDKFLCF